MNKKNIHCNSTLLPLLCLMMLCSCGAGTHSDVPDDDSRLGYTPQVNEVEVVKLELTDFPMQLISNGKLSATGRAALYFKESGVITSLKVANGDLVKKGDVLAELDRSAFESAFESAEIALGRARLEYLDVLAGLGYQAADTARVPEDLMAIAKLRSGYSNADVEYRKAKDALDATILRAPFGGKVADLKLKQWERTGSDPFCTLIDDSSFDVTFTALESEYPFLSKGQDVRVSLFADGSREVRGKISTINPAVDRNGQISVTATVRGDGSMLDGMNVRVIAERTLSRQLVVPKKAVVIRDNLEVLFRYNNGRADWVYVNTTGANSESFVVKANESRGATLREGDLVIVSGNLNLADGSKVTIAEK